jgi:hypothetical protein
VSSDVGARLSSSGIRQIGLEVGKLVAIANALTERVRPT